MLATVAAVLGIIEEWAAPEADHPGLLTGCPADVSAHVLVGLDLTPGLVEAAPSGALLVSRHSPLTCAPYTLRTDEPAGRLLASAVQKGLAIYLTPPNLRLSPGGPADALAGALGLEETAPLSPHATGCHFKLVVFVPCGHEDAVRSAMATAGAGWIGHYSHCTFQSQGQGTFLPRVGADPFLGQVGTLAKVDEWRLETIVPADRWDAVRAAMVAAHPYEEVAYDLYRLENPGPARSPGRVGRLRHPTSLREYAGHCARALGGDDVRYLGQPETMVHRVAVVPGAGGGWAPAARAAGADLLVTGEVEAGHAAAAFATGPALVDAGRQATELPGLRALAARILAGLRQAGLTTNVEVWRDPPWWHLVDRER